MRRKKRVQNFPKRNYIRKKKDAAYEIKLNGDYQSARKIGLELRMSMRLDLNGLISFQTLNKIKEIELKEKIRRGEKIRVAFVVDSLAKFTGANVYKIMCEDSLFEPFIVLYNLAESALKNEFYWNEYQREFHELQALKYDVKPGYDSQRQFIPLESYRPNLVFVSAFYLDPIQININNTYLDINFLVCQLPYGFNIIKSYEYHFNNRRINCAWRYFTATRDEFNELRRYSLHYGLNAVYSGSPRMDEYARPVSQEALPDKLRNGKPIIIYAPHWTIRFNVNLHDLATFDLYYQNFLELVKSAPEFNFVFKPHPSLEYRVEQMKVMTLRQFHDYCEEWNSLPNGFTYYSGDIINLFRNSSLMIMDSGSFIYEWLPSGNPCIYLGNPRRDSEDFINSFVPGARKILNSYYLCWNWDEIIIQFNNLMCLGYDPKAERRRRLSMEIFPNLGEASRRIIEYLKMALAY